MMMRKTGKVICHICAETVSSLILGPEGVRDLRGTGAHHRNGDAIRAGETARTPSPHNAVARDFAGILRGAGKC